MALNDGFWHHICVSWEHSSGSWKLYKDGEIKQQGTDFKKDFTLRKDGSLVLGQKQYSVGGGFAADESFKGMLSNVNVWDYKLTDTQVKEMSTSCLLDEWNAGNIYSWDSFLRKAQARLVTESPCTPLGAGT